MSRGLIWWRMHRGKVWHVSLDGDPVAICGATAEDWPERTLAYPPENARVCSECVDTAEGLAHVARNVADADPRAKQAAPTTSEGGE